MDVLLKPWFVAFGGANRMRRSDYMLLLLEIMLVWLAYMIVLILTGTFGPAGPMLLTFNIALGLASLAGIVAAAIRRVHDFDEKGWIILSVLLFGFLPLLLFGLIRGTEGENAYGPDPKHESGRIGGVFS